MRIRHPFYAYLFACLSIAAACAEPVKVWEGSITIPTYPLYPDNVNPKFVELDGSIIYPYTMQDHLSTEKVDRTYRALFLENEYLKVTCLPQIGGRIHSVFDKTTGGEMFHLNNVIKPGLIAMRGAWISGGIEWNRGPQGHTVTSFSPVNATIQKNDDGSASFVIGYTELNFRTHWNVRLTLHPDKAYLDEHIRIYNPTDGVHSYYFWNNTAFPCNENTRFIYPMTLGTDHGGTNFFNWPIHEGRDLTYLRNYDEPTSVFAYQCAFDFFGAYDVGEDRGIVQCSDHGVLIGKKAWTWGQSDDGIASEKALHDDDSQYIEVQSGPLATQADYGLLEPRQEIAWQEWWYPVHGLGDGFEYATKDIAIQTHPFEKEGWNGIEVRIFATGKFPEAQVDIWIGPEKSLQHVGETVDLAPDAPHVTSIYRYTDDPALICVRDRDGRELARYQSPLPIPQRVQPADAPKNPNPAVEEIYIEGVGHEERIQRADARAAYERALAADPGHTPSLRALAVLDIQAGLYDGAITRLTKALERDPESGASWYWLAVAQLRCGQNDAAIDSAYKSINALDSRTLGWDAIGRARMCTRQYDEATEAFQEAVTLDPNDTRAREHLMAALYASGDIRASHTLARELLDADRLNLAAQAILALGDDDTLAEFAEVARIERGEHAFEFAELGFYFTEMGMTREALALLDAAYAVPVEPSVAPLYSEPLADVSQSPLQEYMRGYFAFLLGDTTRADALLASAASRRTDYVFPSQAEWLPILRHAIARQPNDVNARLYLANLLAGLGRIEEAATEWGACADSANPPSVALRGLGAYAWKEQNDLSRASEYYAKAIAARTSDQTLYRDRAQILETMGMRPDAIALLEGMPLETPRRADVTILLAQYYNAEGRYAQTLELLAAEHFSNWEYNSATWQAFHRAHLELGKEALESGNAGAALDHFTASLTYPENLGVGQPARPSHAEAYYWKGKAFEALGKKDDARHAWAEGAGGHEQSGTQKEYIEKCRASLSDRPA